MPLKPSRLLLPILLVMGSCAQPAPPGPAPALQEEALPALPPPRPVAPAEYAARRAALAERMDDGVLLVVGGEEPAADYLPFAQLPNFRYLTGISEPGALLVMAKRADRVEEHLFVRPRNPSREVWEGPRLGAEGARALTGIPSHTPDELAATLTPLLRATPRLYTPLEVDPPSDRLLETRTPEEQVVSRAAALVPGVQVVSIGAALERLRGVKSETELDLIRRAVQITSLAQRAAMRTVEPGMNEFEIQALIEYTFRRHGAERPAFGTIVGSGPNSTTLHYNADDRFMQAGETLVMDVGASYRGYAADVTRTVPVSGTFTAEQRAIYEIVLAAQKAAEAQVRPGATWDALNETANRVISEGLARLGLIESPTATYDCGGSTCEQRRLFFMHGLGHGIGLEVHDPEVSYSGPFRVGSAFTIEPGIYIRADALDHLPDTPTNRALIQRLRPVVERYRDIGVRIEDDYVVTADGVDRISADSPREIAEIEALMRLPGVGTADRRASILEWYRATTPR